MYKYKKYLFLLSTTALAVTKIHADTTALDSSKNNGVLATKPSISWSIDSSGSNTSDKAEYGHIYNMSDDSWVVDASFPTNNFMINCKKSTKGKWIKNSIVSLQPGEFCNTAIEKNSVLRLGKANSPEDQWQTYKLDMNKLMRAFLIRESDSISVSNSTEQVNQPYNGTGAYVNLNAGIATQQFLPMGSFAGSFNAGFNFNRGFALEAGYTNIAGLQFGASQTNNIFDMAVKGTVPLSSVLDLYGRLGGGVNYMSWGGSTSDAPSWFSEQRSSTNFVGLASLGGSFVLSRHFDLHIEDTLFIPIGGGNATAGQINMIQGGVQFNF